MIYFGQYLKNYLENARISQTDFSIRLGITQKHMNEILNGKTNITLEMAGHIERLTGIDSRFILNIEYNRMIREELLEHFSSEDKLNSYLETFPLAEIKKRRWVIFNDETNAFKTSIDLLNFLKVKDFKVFIELEKKVLKKPDEDYVNLSFWIARCDEISSNQNVASYDSIKFTDLITELKKEAYEKRYELKIIQSILNNYGILFVVEKALPGTNVKGIFKVNGNTPAIYLTRNFSDKNSFFFELFHELKYCKTSYNEGKNKIIANADEEKEREADLFALDVMINTQVWNKIYKDHSLNSVLRLSENYKIPPSFIVGRLVYHNLLNHNSQLYNLFKNE